MNNYSLLKKLIPSWLKTLIINFYYSKFSTQIKIIDVRFKQNLAIKRVKRKDNCNVIFLALFDSIWKYEDLYNLLIKDSRFTVKVVVIPHIVEGNIQMEIYNKTLNYFKNNSYNTFSSYYEENNTWLDIKSILKPDIIFFTLPYSYTLKKYTINNFLDRLTCYVPYNFGNSHLFQLMHNQLFHNLVWRFFAESHTHKMYSEKNASNKGANVKVTGYPGVDKLLRKDYSAAFNWKLKDPSIIKIIWAPHHTIDDDKSFLSYSSFLLYSDVFIKIAEKYQNKVQFAFKPHPILKNKLYNHKDWGKKRADKYYMLWEEMENGILSDGYYIDLFLTSDAMIHDSGSFLIEYLYTGNPVLHTNRDEKITDRLNSFGTSAFNQHYHAKCEIDVINFIENLILKIDPKKKSRKEHFKKYLVPPNGCSASNNVYNEIVQTLF